MYIRKYASNLPPNSMEWGNNVILELVDRLPEIRTFIQEYRTLSKDDRGNAIGIVVLQGQKAVVPVIIKDFSIKPLDIFIYKYNKELRYKYISKRSLMDFMIESSVNRKYDRNSKGQYDAKINVFSPVGEYSGANPFLGMFNGGISKAGSLYVFEELQNHNLMKYASQEIIDSYTVRYTDPKPSYFLLVKEGSDYVYYAPIISENGTVISQQELNRLLDGMEMSQRQNVASTLRKSDMLISGSYFPRPGNILFDIENDEVSILDKKMRVPTLEGVYLTALGETYVNPNLRMLNNERIHNTILGVLSGGFFIKNKLSEFRNLFRSSITRDREDFIPEANNIEIGKVYSLFNEREESITIPFKLIAKTVSDDLRLSITVEPLYASSGPVTIEFYGGNKIAEIRPDYFMYPQHYTKIVSIPAKAVDPDLEKIYWDETTTPPDFVKVTFYNLGDTFNFVENGTNSGVLTKGQALFTLLNKYKMSVEQADAIIKKSMIVKKINFLFKPEDLERSWTTEAINNKINNKEMPLQEKEALNSIIKLASNIDNYLQKNEIPPIKIKLASKRFEDLFTKFAADVDNPKRSQAEDRAQANEENMNAGAPQQSPALSALLQTNPIQKSLGDIINKILSVYNKTIRVGDTQALISLIVTKLREIENYLGNALFLIQTENLPGVSYQETKNLLSDIDGYISALEGSRVIIRNLS